MWSKAPGEPVMENAVMHDLPACCRGLGGSLYTAWTRIRVAVSCAGAAAAAEAATSARTMAEEAMWPKAPEEPVMEEAEGADGEETAAGKCAKCSVLLLVTLLQRCAASVHSLMLLTLLHHHTACLRRSAPCTLTSDSSSWCDACALLSCHMAPAWTKAESTWQAPVARLPSRDPGQD